MIPRPIAVKKSASIQNGTIDEDSAEEVIIVESPQRQQQQPLTEQNVLKLMANKFQDLPAQNLLQPNPASNYVLRSSEKKKKKNESANACSDDDDEEDDDEQLRNPTMVARRTTPFNRAGKRSLGR